MALSRFCPSRTVPAYGAIAAMAQNVHSAITNNWPLGDGPRLDQKIFCYLVNGYSRRDNNSPRCPVSVSSHLVTMSPHRLLDHGPILSGSRKPGYLSSSNRRHGSADWSVTKRFQWNVSSPMPHLEMIPIFHGRIVDPPSRPPHTLPVRPEPTDRGSWEGGMAFSSQEPQGGLLCQPRICRSYCRWQ